MRPFSYKVPFFHRSIGMIVIMILLLAAIVPVSYAKTFGGHGSVATWVPTAFLAATFVFATRNSVPTFLLGISYEN